MPTKIPKNSTNIIPRIIRIRDAPFYVGMDKNRFNAEVRPFLTEMKIGTQGVAFDRIELDTWVDDFKSRVGKTPTQKLEKTTCQRKSPASSKGTTSGTSIKLSKEDAFAKALEQATKKKPKPSSCT
jgi:hypothetical protein